MTTNIGYWEKILKNPNSLYEQLFVAEKDYLIARIPKGSSVIDVGCGDGTTIQTLLPVAAVITGIDNDTEAIRDAEARLLPDSRINLVFADALALPFPDKMFDVATHMMTLVNSEGNKVKALKEMGRIIKDDGKIIISVYSEDALSVRLETYQQIGVPIEKIEGTKVIFDKSVGANKSEQFSKEELAALAQKAGLKIEDCTKIGGIAYICELTKLKRYSK